MSLKDVKSDKLLLVRLKCGDERAFSAIYDLHAKGLIRYTFDKTGDLTQAQDLVQDIFTKLWDRRESLTPDTNLSAYLYKQALNRCLNLFRHHRVVEAHLVNSLAEFVEVEYNTPDRVLLDAELSKAIQDQIDALSPQMRKTIELRLHQGYTNKEIAQEMELSEHTVATQIKRALKVLRGKLRYIHSPIWVFLFLF